MQYHTPMPEENAVIDILNRFQWSISQVYGHERQATGTWRTHDAAQARSMYAQLNPGALSKLVGGAMEFTTNVPADGNARAYGTISTQPFYFEVRFLDNISVDNAYHAGIALPV